MRDFRNCYSYQRPLMMVNIQFFIQRQGQFIIKISSNPRVGEYIRCCIPLLRFNLQ